MKTLFYTKTITKFPVFLFLFKKSKYILSKHLGDVFIWITFELFKLLSPLSRACFVYVLLCFHLSLVSTSVLSLVCFPDWLQMFWVQTLISLSICPPYCEVSALFLLYVIEHWSFWISSFSTRSISQFLASSVYLCFILLDIFCLALWSCYLTPAMNLRLADSGDQ